MDSRRRLALLWGVLAVLAVAGGALAALMERRAGTGAPTATLVPAASGTAAPEPGAASPAAADAPERRRARRPRRPKLPTGRSVRATLRRAVLTGAITPEQYRRRRADATRARAAVLRIQGARRAELASVLGTLDGLAASGRLTVSRMPLAFLTLRRNTAVWTKRRFPQPGQRMTFGRDPAVFQYYAGRGVQHHPLASAGKANALVMPCLRRRERLDAKRLAQTARRAARQRAGGRVRARRSELRVRIVCRERRLRRSLDSLATLASRRGGFVAWEYLFRYGAGSPPWMSAMAQATAAQALARGGEALDEQRYRDVALASLGAFETAPPLGVAVRQSGGRHYLMYSFDPGLRILNGFLQSVIGLHDVATLTGSRRAARLARHGERAARRAVASYDTGAWSLYSFRGRESTLGYHDLVTGFLAGMCERTARARYCDAGERFERYMREPPRVRVSVPGRPRGAVPAGVAVRLSKLASVRVTVTGRRGTLLRRRAELTRGRSVIAWTPPAGGRYRVRVAATGPEGRTAVERTTVRVRPSAAQLARRRAARERRRQAAERRRAAAQRREARAERERAIRPRRGAGTGRAARPGASPS